MADTVIVGPNQSVGDVVLMKYGTMEAYMHFCRVNNISPTAIPAVGTELLAPDRMPNGKMIPVDKAVLKYIADNNVAIGTANVDVDLPPLVFRVVLYPNMDIVAATDVPAEVGGEWDMRWLKNADFVTLNGLAHGWSTPKQLLAQTENRWHINTTPVGIFEWINQHQDEPALEMGFKIDASGEAPDEYMTFRVDGASSTGEVFPLVVGDVLFRDTADVNALFSPIVVMSKKGDPQEVVAVILPEITIHANPVTGGLRCSIIIKHRKDIVDALGWTLNAGKAYIDSVEITPYSDVVGIDPDDHEVRLLHYDEILPVGLHTITAATNVTIDVPNADAVRDMVIEVY